MTQAPTRQDCVRIERRGHALWARLDRAEALNGLNPSVAEGLHQAMDVAAGEAGIHALVVTGDGRAFCSGADLKYLQGDGDGRQPDFSAFLQRVGDVFDRLEQFPKPVVAAVNGFAVAGGLELLLCCDLVIAAESAKIGDGHANYGLLPGAGGSVRLSRKIGITRAKHLLFTGSLVQAREMLNAGLVNQVVPDAELDLAVDALVETLAAKSPIALRRTKQLVNDAGETSLPVALRAEQALSELHRHSYDMAEGLAAFSEKRGPLFKGC
ncbi:enoyl-CoA hydratase/isomerase family protein [Rhodococcus sp. NPDC127530]|uniref:enoyl-CoA hydratase/isomerase family protein n=1 Tax=unclassified Rhodococcus (in: high G+C Gram-positive bacteria) TaxID=192944 RepID=UPI0036275E4B